MNIAPEYLPALQRRLSTRRRQLAGSSPAVFARTYLAVAFDRPASRMHNEVLAALANLHERRGMHLAIAAPRGHAKSTVVTLAYVLWCLLYGKEPFIVLASGTEQQAARLLEHVKRHLETNLLLRTDFPELADVRRVSPWRKDSLLLPTGGMVMAFSTGQNLRGVRGGTGGKHRPTLIVADDLEDRQNVPYEEQRAKLNDWFHSTLLKAGSPDTNVIVVGTVLHHDSLLANLLDTSKRPGWRGMRYQAVERFSDRGDLWDRYAAVLNGSQPYPAGSGQWGDAGAAAFLREHEAEMVRGTQVLWPEQYSYLNLMHTRMREGEATFQAEFQNQPLDPQACIFASAKLRYWDDIAVSAEELLSKLGTGSQAGRESGEFYGACDPSLGGDPHRGDYSAIIVLFVPERSGSRSERNTKYVIAADIARRTPDDTISRIVQLAKLYQFKRFAVEGNQFQELMIDMLKQRASRAGASFRVENIKNRVGKQQRVMAIEAEVSQGLVVFTRHHQLLLEQLRAFPSGKHDDGPDALEMAIAMANRPCYCELVAL